MVVLRTQSYVIIRLIVDSGKDSLYNSTPIRSNHPRMSLLSKTLGDGFLMIFQRQSMSSDQM